MDLSEMLSNGQDKIQASRKPREDDDESGRSDLETDEGESDDESALEVSESESEQDDDQLDKLGAFVDSLSSKIKEREKEVEQSVDVAKPSPGGRL